jgi:hypothetical protein
MGATEMCMSFARALTMHLKCGIAKVVSAIWRAKPAYLRDQCTTDCRADKLLLRHAAHAAVAMRCGLAFGKKFPAAWIWIWIFHSMTRRSSNARMSREGSSRVGKGDSRLQIDKVPLGCGTSPAPVYSTPNEPLGLNRSHRKSFVLGTLSTRHANPKMPRSLYVAVSVLLLVLRPLLERPMPRNNHNKRDHDSEDHQQWLINPVSQKLPMQLRRA